MRATGQGVVEEALPKYQSTLTSAFLGIVAADMSSISSCIGVDFTRPSSFDRQPRSEASVDLLLHRPRIGNRSVGDVPTVIQESVGINSL